MDNNPTAKLLEETANLIERYNKDLSFQHALDRILDNPQISLRRIMYRGRPLKLYTDIISRTLWKYRDYRQLIKTTPGEAKNLLKSCYNQRDLNDLSWAKNRLSQIFSPQEQQEINRIENLPQEQKPKEFKKVLEKQDQLLSKLSENPAIEEIQQQEEEDIEIGNEETTYRTPPRQINPPKLRIPVQIEKFIAKYTQPARLVSFLSTPLKLVRQVVAGGGNLALKGAATGGGKAFRGGLKALDGLTEASRGGVARVAVSTGIRALLANPIVLAILIILIAIPLLFIFMTLLQQNSLLTNPYTGDSLISVAGSGCPSTLNNKNPLTCQYLNPSVNIFGDLTDQQINTYISNYWKQSELAKEEFSRRTNLLVGKARQVGLNPVIFLGYWKSESWFGDSLGCIYAPQDFNSQADCAVGLTSGGSRVIQCAAPKSPYHNQGCQDLKSIIMSHLDIYDSALFRFNYTTNHYNPQEEPNPVSTLDAIAEGYGPRSQKLEGEGIINHNCSHTYNILVDTAKELGACQSSVNTVIADASCPVPGGKITCASYGPVENWGGFYGSCAVDASGNGGHCNTAYQGQVGICSTRTKDGQLIRTAKSIDITGKNQAGEPVYLPDINGQKLTWYYKGTISAGADFGWMRLFQSEKTAEGVWSIHFVHVNADDPPLAIDQPLQSGSLGATMYNLGAGQIHVHVTVGLNVGDSVSNLQDYSPNWLSADRDLKMCIGG